MKYTISPSATLAAARVAIVARLFLGLVVDMPTTQNGAWFSAIIGALLAAPLVFLLSRYRHRSGPLLAVLGALAVFDSASVIAVISRSAAYLALDRSPTLLLSLSIAIAALWSLWRGGDAVGYASMIWARIAIVLLVGVILLQVRDIRPRWLCPLLGDGWRAILDGGVKSAGWIVAAASILVLADDVPERINILPMLFTAVAMTAALIVMRCMLVPTQLRGGWLNRLDALLCNGRTPLYLQMPMIVLWFAGLFHLLVCELMATSLCLRVLIPRLHEKLCALSAVAISVTLSRSNVLGLWMKKVSSWNFAAIGAIVILSCVLTRRKGGGLACGLRDS